MTRSEKLNVIDEVVVPTSDNTKDKRAISILDDGETWGGPGTVRFLTEEEMASAEHCGDLDDIASNTTTEVDVSELIETFLRKPDCTFRFSDEDDEDNVLIETSCGERIPMGESLDSNSFKFCSFCGGKKR